MPLWFKENFLANFRIGLFVKDPPGFFSSDLVDDEGTPNNLIDDEGNNLIAET